MALRHSCPAHAAVMAELAAIRRATLRLRPGSPEASRVAPPLLLHQRLHDRILEIAVKFAVGIVGLHHENANDFLLRVHPKMCPESSVPTIAAIGNAITRGDRVAHHLHAQSEAAAFW